MVEHHDKCTLTYFNWFEDILKQGIEKGEIHPNAIRLSKGLFVLGDGIFVAGTKSSISLDIKEEINNYIDALFEFIEVKK
ncbi:MAG: hypothetical protein OIF32_05010 [Campylobacterales bacterium]|nr:hypothetical protein [Campylobacterales bacterium]